MILLKSATIIIQILEFVTAKNDNRTSIFYNIKKSVHCAIVLTQIPLKMLAILIQCISKFQQQVIWSTSVPRPSCPGWNCQSKIPPLRFYLCPVTFVVSGPSCTPCPSDVIWRRSLSNLHQQLASPMPVIKVCLHQVSFSACKLCHMF